MVAGGIEDVFVTNEIVWASKIARLVALASRAKVKIVEKNGSFGALPS